MSTPVVEVTHLRKQYGTTVAVADVSFAVQPGEIFGLIGPNGAGKTTTVECLAGLRTADAGTTVVLGTDTQRHSEAVRDILGVQLQESELAPKITVAEALTMYASFYADHADPEDLIALLDLGELRDRRFGQLSGGQKQRLSIALALVGNPQVAVLDELTTGLDPAARRATWDLVERVRDSGVTIVLITHFMDEAERLCDRLAIIDGGRVVVTGSPRELVDALETGRTVRLEPTDRERTLAVLEPLVGSADIAAVTALDDGQVEVRGSRRVIVAVVQALEAADALPEDVRTVRRNLEDVFVAVTGRGWSIDAVDNAPAPDGQPDKPGTDQAEGPVGIVEPTGTVGGQTGPVTEQTSVEQTSPVTEQNSTIAGQAGPVTGQTSVEQTSPVTEQNSTVAEQTRPVTGQSSVTEQTRPVTGQAGLATEQAVAAPEPAQAEPADPTPTPRPHGRGMRGFATMLRTETRVWLRDPGSVFFGLAFPTVLLLGIGLLIPGMRDAITDGSQGTVYQGMTPVAVMVPVILAVALATPALTIIPVTIATQREKGVLRRLSTTPMRPQGVFATSYLINLAATLVAAVIAVGIGAVVFDLSTPRNLAVVVVGFVLGLASMFALGTLIAARAPRGATASAIGSLVYFPMLLFAGLWTPGPIMPDLLLTIARFTPLGASAQAMTTGWFDTRFPLIQVVVMVGWTAVLLPLSIKLFRWS